MATVPGGIGVENKDVGISGIVAGGLVVTMEVAAACCSFLFTFLQLQAESAFF